MKMNFSYFEIAQQFKEFDDSIEILWLLLFC